VLKYIGEADVLYFATHGIASEEDPMKKSFLVLSGADPFLTAKDIMDSRKSYKKFPEMVILSACQTGLGKSTEAGVAGLARSFMLAGSYHVIMSLWNVDDEATAYLMNRFLFHLRKRSRFMPAEPLRQAALDTRKKFPKPSQWASFSLFGIDY
jgi:CHAT domain-containing protein